MSFGGKPATILAAVTLSVFVLVGCGSGHNGDYSTPVELEQEAQIDQYGDEMDQRNEEWAQDTWEDDLISVCVDDQIANGYNSYQAKAYCIDNFDLYMPEPEPEPEPDYGYEDYGYEDYGYEDGFDYGR